MSVQPTYDWTCFSHSLLNVSPMPVESSPPLPCPTPCHLLPNCTSCLDSKGADGGWQHCVWSSSLQQVPHKPGLFVALALLPGLVLPPHLPGSCLNAFFLLPSSLLPLLPWYAATLLDTPSPELPNLLIGSLLWLFIPFPPPLGPFQPPPLSVASYSAFEILGGSNRHLPSPQPRVGFSSETVAVGVV